MNVLSLIKQYCSPLNISLGEELGYGADGQCFNIVDNPNQVIKLSVLYDMSDDFIIKSQIINQTLNYIKNNNTYPYVRVYEYIHLGSYSRCIPSWKDGKQNFILYYYIMEKLNKISDDEKKVFHTLLSHEDRGIIKDYSLVKITEMLKGMQRGLDFDLSRVKLFCQAIKLSPLIHNDLHIRNIMKTQLGEFKLIDLDRLKLEK